MRQTTFAVQKGFSMKRLSWKYIAGLVDGEGCIDLQINKHKNYPDNPYIRPRIRITLTESCKFLLDIFTANFEGGGYMTKRTFINPVWQNAYTWGLYGKKARPFLQNIVNHLYIKKEQARLAIWIIDNVMGKHVSKELREHLNNEIKAMKLSPHRLSEIAILEANQIVEQTKALDKNKICLKCGHLMRYHTTRDKHIKCGGKLRTFTKN